MFQFQLGAINTGVKVDVFSVFNKFQFQLGAINTRSPCTGWDTSWWFQFQLGAINTVTVSLSPSNTEGFNSN